MSSNIFWENISYIEIVFRGWPANTSTNTTLNIGLQTDVTATASNGIYFQYSTNQAPTGVWNVKVDTVSKGSLAAPMNVQFVNTWCKVRIENTNDTGSFAATFTDLSTNNTQTISSSGVTPGVPMFVGGLVTCVSGGVVKSCDFDNITLQLK
jgi:hypothetical protein